MEIIKLNLIPSGVNPTCHCSQYDNGRVIRIDLFDGLTPYVLQSGDTVTLNVRKPDNTIVTASVTATQGNTYVNIETTEQICACVGYNLCDLTITNGSVVIGTLNFIMQVERDVLADGVPSQSVIEDLDALVQEAVGDNYYTKSEVDDALDLKADKSTTYTKTETNNALALKASASEVENIRVGFDGKTYASAGDAVRGQFELVDDNIKAYETNLTPLSVSNGYIKGVDGTFVSNDGYRASDYIFIGNALSKSKLKNFCSLASNAGIAFYKLDKTYISGISGNTASTHGYTTGNALRYFEIPEDATYFRTSLQASAYSQLSDMKVTFLNLSSLNKLFLYKYAIRGTISSIVNENNIIHDNIKYSADSIAFITDGYGYTGIDFDLYNLAYKNCITVKSSRNVGNNFNIRIQFFDNSNNVLSNIYTNDTELSSIVPKNAARANITLAACWGTALTSGTVVTFSDVSIAYESLEGTGDNIYTGKPIILNNDYKKKNKCNINLWKDFLGSEISGLADYNLYLNEAMAIFGDYVFLFNGNGGGIVVDYATKNIVSQFTNEPTENNHQNSAQFLDIYYNDNDEFPLLMVSRCGNTSTVTGKDEALIYRVVRSGSSFTFTLINSITFDFRTYGTSWGIDIVTKKLYLTAFVNGGWSVTDNPINFWAFNMPSKMSIISGTQITLNESDILAHCTFDYAIFQGLTVINNIVYIAVQEPVINSEIKKAVIYAVDVYKGQILSKVPLLITDEPEGVAIYNNKLYVTQKKGNDTSGVNPLKIYEIGF